MLKTNVYRVNWASASVDGL